MPARDSSTAQRRSWPLVVIPMLVAGASAAVWSLVVVGADGPEGLVAAALGVAAGLLLGLLALLVARRLDRTVRTSKQLRNVTSVPNLAVVPRQPLGERRPDDVAAVREPDSIEAEAYRTLRTAVDFILRDSGATVLLVTSPRPGEGKSSVAANLAATSAMAGKSVVLIDGDMRRPQAHRLFGLRNDKGLSTVLDGSTSVSHSVQRASDEYRLALLSAGPPPNDPAELLINERLRLTIRGMAESVDLVVIDAPPVLPVTDPTILVQHSDATLLVATAGLSDEREWVETMMRLEIVEANVIGTAILQPDPRIEAIPTYRYSPTAVPKNWWVAGASTRDGETGDGDRDDFSTDDVWWSGPSAVASGSSRIGSPAGHSYDEAGDRSRAIDGLSPAAERDLSSSDDDSLATAREHGPVVRQPDGERRTAEQESQ